MGVCLVNYDLNGVSCTPLCGKQVDLSASSGPLYSICERKRMHINRQERIEVAENKNTMQPGFDAGKYCKVIMSPETTPRWLLLYSFKEFFKDPHGSTVPSSPLPNDARRARGDGGKGSPRTDNQGFLFYFETWLFSESLNGHPVTSKDHSWNVKKNTSKLLENPDAKKHKPNR